jgi:predicted DCC family thiol-disulfide oxidoreductase YuxK
MTVPVVRFVVAGADAPPAIGDPSRPYTVIYDGACKVCGRLVKVLQKWDRKHQLEILPSQAAGVQARFPWIPARAYAESVQLIGPGGRTWQGAAAIEQLLDVLPKGGLISWIFSIPFVRPLAERFYRWFARNRYRLGCGEHCQFRELQLEFDDEPSPAAADSGRGARGL